MFYLEKIYSYKSYFSYQKTNINNKNFMAKIII